MPTSNINGVRLFWQQRGESGIPLVLVHGSWTDHHTWDLVAPALATQDPVWPPPGLGTNWPDAGMADTETPPYTPDPNHTDSSGDAIPLVTGTDANGSPTVLESVLQQIAVLDGFSI